MDGYTALREHAAWLDLSSRGRIRVTGEDRTRLLHAMLSNHVEQLRPGGGCYSFFLNAQGRILGDLNLLCLPDAFLIDTEPELRAPLYEHLDKYIIVDDVALEDVTGSTAALGIEGPAAAQILASLNAPVPEAPYAYSEWEGRLVAHLSSTGSPGYRIFLPSAEKHGFIARLDIPAATADEARTVRLELGHPRYGEDFSEKHLPHETQLLDAVHFNKGCYLGQEIVERVRSRGGVHRFLVPVAVEATAPPPPETKILLADKEVGEITSAAWSPAEGRVVGLAYLRLNEIPQGAALSAAGAPLAINASKPRT